MPEPILELHEVTKRIEKQTLVEPVTLTVATGSVLALCGGNGAGKSTLLRMIAGISQPSGGTVRIRGQQWASSRRAYADSIGYMPDDFQFGSALTAQETLEFYAALRGVKRARVLELLETVGLSDVRRKPVTSFSKGMRQRLLFAQAMLAKPPLLLLDEPTNGLDPYWMDAFAGLVRQVAADGQAVVFSTHQLNVAELVADQVVFLDAGVVRFSGSVRQLKEQYRNAGGLYGAFRDFVITNHTDKKGETIR
ncbi:hypothetical protein J31TS4_37200 [Paenibacillus sp. J31TS4]|uniref:heme ABC exporter ATP-binding protein CcmA n=1 Tax=Paenibacillus sp. J31TS4 TaxID=2807195 RepID=UPI001B091562|nr:heme ABC exporter ATP-binding protein CcmA [Paenibacillus sp. J31TS4]GIP40440.1 hypothetical protein J31TS4_37200 [Paenibacillus sp. J31TS4]